LCPLLKERLAELASRQIITRRRRFQALVLGFGQSLCRPGLGKLLFELFDLLLCRQPELPPSLHLDTADIPLLDEAAHAFEGQSGRSHDLPLQGELSRQAFLLPVQTTEGRVQSPPLAFRSTRDDGSLFAGHAALSVYCGETSLGSAAPAFAFPVEVDDGKRLAGSDPLPVDHQELC
jgi:hypothetical protein